MNKEKTPQYYKEREKKTKETRKKLSAEKQLEYPTEAINKKIGIPAKEILKLRKSEEAQDQLLIETIRQRVRNELDKEITEQDIKRLENLEKLTEKEKKELIIDLNTLILYEKGLADDDEYVRRGTAKSLGSLAEKDPENFIRLYEKGLADHDDDVREGTAKSLGSLVEKIDFRQRKKIERILKNKYKISDQEIIYSYQIISNLLKNKEDLGELITKYLPELKTIKEFSKEVNSQLAEDKKTKNIEKFWEKNQIGTARLQLFDISLSTQLIKQQLRLFGFPRTEKLLNTSEKVFSNPEISDSLKKITDSLTELNTESFSRLMNLADAFNRMNFKDSFNQLAEKLQSKDKLTDKEALSALGKELLQNFAQKLDIEVHTTQSDISKWNLEYISKLFEAEKDFEEEDKEFLRLIIKSTFQEKSFKEALLGNHEGEYSEDEKEWLEELENYTNKVKREFQEKGIDFNRWFNYEKTEEFKVGSSFEDKKNKQESFNKELNEVIVNLLGSYREKKKGLLSKEDAKQVFNSVFKKYGIQFKQGEFHHKQKGKLNIKDIEPVLSDFNKTIEQIYKKEKNKETKENIATNLSHLQDLESRLPELSKELERQGYHFLIKPWDRNPGYDIFQGNYTHCCIAVENFNRGAILDYLSDSGMQVVEIKDQTEDKTIAQTYMFFSEEPDGDINLVLDNVEVNSDYAGLSDKIRENLFEYIKKYSLDVCPKTTKILLGTAYNDVKTSDLEERNVTQRKIGGAPRKTEYLDAFGSSAWIEPGRQTNRTLRLVAEDIKRGKIEKEKTSRRYITESIKEINKDTLNQILEVEKASFPEQMQSDIEDLRETLENERGIQLITKNKEDKIVSYLSSEPIEDAYEELKDYDPELKPEKDSLYVESIATRPENRDIKILLKNLNTIKKEAREKGYRKITAHVRVNNNLSNVLQKKGFKKLRTMKNWHNFNEPFDYLELEL
ncbi:MAG: hypothetical protein GF387_03400 [Candidatus Portnoybacteria bacterium]|nr:hypothetical protein [Candidatus Portnoybacteria bacterium]